MRLDTATGWVISSVAAFFIARSASGAIVVGGVTDRTNYTNTATFCVWDEAGYTYHSLLDNSPISENLWVTLKQIGYHEILVIRTNTTTQAAETNLTRFTVTASERFSAENGIAPWTPYPPVDSSSNECASSKLVLIAPSNYPTGMEIPIIAVTENAIGLWKRLNGTVSLGNMGTIGMRRGSGFAFFPTQTAGTVISCTGSLKSISDTQTVRIDPATTWTTPATVISANTTWGPDARIHITANTMITNNAILTIQTGTVVRIDAGADLSFKGTLRVNGTRESPVVFAPSDRTQPWGGFIFSGTGCLASVTHAIITGTGANTNWMFQHGINVHKLEQAAFFLGDGTRAALTNVYLINLAGQAWVGQAAPVSVRSCLVQRALTSGEMLNSTSVFVNCTFQELPSYDEQFSDSDNDGIYLEFGSTVFSDSFIGWTKDDAIDTGSYDGPVAVSNCWFESCFHEGMAIAGASNRFISCEQVAVINCGQGFEGGYGAYTARVNNCLSIDNENGLRFGDNYAFGYAGLLAVSNSIVIHNDKDTWNMCFDVWTPKPTNLVLQSNLFSVAQSGYVSNGIWNPTTDYGRLAPFIARATTNGPVGIGFPRPSSTNMTATTAGVIMVSLSMFATNTVSVDYWIAGGTATAGQDYILTNGTMTFEPGEFRKGITFPVFNTQPTGTAKTVILQLTNALNGEIAASQATFIYAIPTNSTTNAANTLIAKRESWSYLDDGSDQHSAWSSPVFADSAWHAGPALLGYGDTDIVTTIGYGTNAAIKYITDYYRKGFNLTNASAITSALFSCQVDDGAVVYLNGTEIGRYLMTNGVINYQSFATNNSPETNWVDFVVTNLALFRNGANVIAAEVHQVGLNSSDTRFDLTAHAWWAPMASPTSDWTAYNDCAWTTDTNGFIPLGDPSSASFTKYSPWAGLNGSLRDTNGAQLAVQVSFSGVTPVLLERVISMPTGSDAETIFSNHIGTNNAANWTNGNVIMTLTGLDTGRQYNVVLWSTRGATTAAYTNRFTDITLSGVNVFQNHSSAGVPLLTNSMPGDGCRMRAAWQDKVVRYDAIIPGPSGTATFTLTAGADAFDPLSESYNTNGYLNAFMIQTVPSSGITDNDGDGMDDSWEVLYFASTNAVNGNASGDWDQDGFDNLSEYIAGTDPASAASLLSVQSQALVATTNQMVITWSSVTGKTYALQTATNLFNTWTVGFSGIVGVTPLNTYTVNMTSTRQLWRVKVE